MNGVPASTRTPALPDTRGLREPARSWELLRDLVRMRTGLSYDDARLDYMRDRLAPLALDRGFDSVLDYYYLLKYDANADAEWPRAIDALSVQETYFWRESDQLRALTGVVVPMLAAQGRADIRIWSVPCATGEEPLSIAIALEEAGWFDRLRIQIHASDASEAALRRARAGRYSLRSFRQLPEELRQKYFDNVSGSEWMVKPAIRARVASWTRVNLVQRDEVEPLAGADVIFCRNVFIYFDQGTVQHVVDTFAEHMPSPGFLCVGASESLLRLTSRFELQDLSGAYVYVKP